MGESSREKERSLWAFPRFGSDSFTSATLDLALRPHRRSPIALHFCLWDFPLVALHPLIKFKITSVSSFPLFSSLPLPLLLLKFKRFHREIISELERKTDMDVKYMTVSHFCACACLSVCVSIPPKWEQTLPYKSMFFYIFKMPVSQGLQFKTFYYW